MNTSPEYLRRQRQLRDTHAWPKSALMDRCAALGVYGTSGGPHGLGRWTRDELVTEILQAEFPPAPVTGS